MNFEYINIDSTKARERLEMDRRIQNERNYRVMLNVSTTAPVLSEPCHTLKSEIRFS